MSQDYSILPEGYIHAYVAGFNDIYYDVDEHGNQDAGYKSMSIHDASTGDHLFDIDEDQGSGDYRGFPAGVFQFPFIDDRFFNAAAPYVLEDETAEPTWEDVLHGWSCELGPQIQFILKRGSDTRYGDDSSYSYHFIGWLPTDDDFDLEDELESMDIPELEDKDYEVKVFVKCKGRNEDEAQQLFDELFSCELPYEIDGIEEV